MAQFDTEAAAMIDRNSTYRFDWDLDWESENLFIGDKALIYLHPIDFNVYNNFW